MRILLVWSPQDPYFIYYLYIMARIKLSPIVTQISGSIGGITIQRNKFGISMRQKPLPFKSQSSAQYVIRQHMITIQHAWQNLTDAQRLQWNRFLDFSGQTINKDKSVKLSGHALYLKYQMFRLLAGYSLLTTIAYVPMPAQAVVVGVTVAADSLQLEVSASQVHTTQFFLFFMTVPKLENQAPSRRGLRYMYIVPATHTVFQFKDSYKAAFGVLPAVDTWFHYSIQSFSVLAPVYSGVTFGKFICEA